MFVLASLRVMIPMRATCTTALLLASGLPHGLLTVDQGCRDSNVAGATYPSDECRRTRL